MAKTLFVQPVSTTLTSAPNTSGQTSTYGATLPGVIIPDVPVISLVDASTITIDLSVSTKFTLLTTSAVGSSRTIAFANGIVGQVYSLEIVQAASGGPYAIALPGVLGSPPSLTPTAGNHDLLTFYCRAANSFAVALAIPDY